MELGLPSTKPRTSLCCSHWPSHNEGSDDPRQNGGVANAKSALGSISSRKPISTLLIDFDARPKSAEKTYASCPE